MAKIATSTTQRKSANPSTVFAWCDPNAIQPVSIESYPDTVHIWLGTALPHEGFLDVYRHCRGGLQRIAPPKGVPVRGRGYALQQPTAEALRILARHNDIRLTRVDEALDLVFATFHERDAAAEFMHRHMVKKFHRRAHGIVHFKRTRYTAPAKVRSKLVTYPTEYSRSTGEVDCDVLHVEWRMFGKRVLQQNGIETCHDILNNNRNAFWRERLLLYAFDPEHLGRMHCHWLGKRKQDREEHIRIGGVLCRGWIVQDNLDRFRPYFRVREALHRLPVEHLLPEPRRGQRHVLLRITCE